MFRFAPALAVVVGTLAAPADNGGADLAIRATHLDLARARDTFGFSVAVANNGPSPARNAEVVVLLPPGVAVRSKETCKISRGGGLARCALGTINAGGEREVFLLLVSAERQPRVSAIVLSETPDPDASNNMR